MLQPRIDGQRLVVADLIVTNVCHYRVVEAFDEGVDLRELNMPQGLKTTMTKELEDCNFSHLTPEWAVAGEPKGCIVVSEVETGLGPWPGGQDTIVSGEALTDRLMRADENRMMDTEQ